MLKINRELYNKIGIRLYQLVGDTLGSLLVPKRNPMYKFQETVSFSYIFEENKNIYLYIKDTNDKIVIEIKDFETQRSECVFNADMSKARDIIIELYEKVTERIDTDTILENLFNSEPTTFGEQHQNLF